MDYTHRIPDDIPDDEAATGQYDEAAIRCGALELIVSQQRAQIAALKAENARLNEQLRHLDDLACSVAQTQAKGIVDLFESNKAQATEIERLLECIAELERENLSQDFIDRHNACEAGWNGRIDNRR